MGKKSGAKAPKQAAKIQAEAAKLGIEEQRRQFDFITGLLNPFVELGTDQISAITQGATASGLDDRLGEIFNTDIFSNLTQQRTDDANNLFSQRGLSRSGGAIQELANIPTETALALESELFGRQNSLFSNGQNAAAGLGAAGQQTGNAISNLLSQSGNAQAQGVIGGAQANAAAQQNTLSGLLSIGSMFFSDPRLKTNMEPVGKVVDLTLYEWDWVDEMPDELGLMGIGYNADEVQEKYPQFVGEVSGLKAINYPALNDHLEELLEAA